MIEIVLAIAILAFGFASILGLFPVALKAVRNSQVEGIAADAANDLYGYYKSYANVRKPSSDEYLYTDLFDYSGTGTLVDWYEETDLNAFRTNYAVAVGDMRNGQVFYKELQTKLKDAPPNSPPNLSSLGFIEVIGLFQPDKIDKKSYFYLVKGSEDLKKIDFTAQVLVWRTQMEKVYTTESLVEYSRAVILNVEISWPINVSYPDREKRFYQFTITNPKKI